MIINANDRYIGASIQQFGAWATDDIEIIKSMLDILLGEKSLVTMYDVGANIGTHAVALAKHFGPRIAMRAFEAQRHVYYALCGNVALNGLDNVVCEHVAVSDGTVDRLDIQLPDYNQPNNFGGFEVMPAVNSDNADMHKSHTETIVCRTIDSYNESVDFVKLDVEGMEIRALQGAKKTLERSRPICFVEVLKSDKLAIHRFFYDLDYLAYRYKDDDWIFVPCDSDVELDLPKILL
jgi:FkbM family methyltransferase